jgi:uncharacterized phage-associated protein
MITSEVSSPTTGVDKNLEGVLAEICSRLGTITITKAVKLPYLVDVIAHQVLGRRVTKGTFQAWEHGVATREVWDLIKHDNGGDYFEVGVHNYSEGGSTVALANDVTPPVLSTEDAMVTLYAIERFGGLSAGDLGDLTKSLNPHFSAEEWGSNRTPNLDEGAFSRLTPEWLDLWRRLPDLDLDDPELWGEPIVDPKAFAKETLGA